MVPDGWLLEQLKIQASGLSGHLAMFWPDVHQSMWLNGENIHGDLSGNHSEPGHFKDDGGLHERGVYWLNGFIPLAYQLRAAGITVLQPKCGHRPHAEGEGDHEIHQRPQPSVPVGPVRPLEQVQTFVSAILASVNTTDGWIGPGDRPTISESGHPPDGGIYWGRSNAMFSLIHFAEAEKHLMNHATFREVAEVVKNYFLCQKRMLSLIHI